MAKIKSKKYEIERVKNIRYQYAILVENTQERRLWQESAVYECKHQNTKYALIERNSNADGTEKINRIIYSDDYQTLAIELKKYISWYDRIAGMCKDIQQYVRQF